MRQIPIRELIGDVVAKSDRTLTHTIIVFRSGRCITICDAPHYHETVAWEPNT